MSFGEDVAATYDDEVVLGDEEATVSCLEQLARGGPVLELAVGTGRIALPLAARGLAVTGVDLSEPMVARLRAKPGGDRMPVTIGNFADVPVPGCFRLVYVVFNTLFNLLTQDEQVRCFGNVAAHLSDDGLFVVEAFTPAFLYRLDDDQYVEAEKIGDGEVRLDVGQHDPVQQRLDEAHVSLSPGGIGVRPIATRYAWPSELDLMGRLAGLRLHQRWAGWDRQPVDATSSTLVSVFGR